MDKGQRVELHPATDEWMSGDRFGVIVGFGRQQQICFTKGSNEYWATGRLVRVKLDVSGRVRRFHPDNVTVL